MGQRFAGRYELVDLLGEGGGATVWRAWDARERRYVAAKLLRQGDAGALLRFVREQSLRVQHPHVVAPTGWAAEDDEVLLTMDLVGGGSLDSLLGDHGPLPLAVVVPLLDQLLDALGAVHAAGLVHRDVTPGNVLLEPTGTAAPFLRLADFGIAASVGGPRLTGLGHVPGTPGHVAPEARAGADPDPRQDLWAVGVLAAQLLSGQRPDPAADRADVVPGLPWAVQAWVDRLSDPDPSRRPASAAEARSVLAEAVAVQALPVPDEPVEVFDHLAALPPGWGADGPEGQAAAPPPLAGVDATPSQGVPPSAPSSRPAPDAVPPAPAAAPTAPAPAVVPPALRSGSSAPAPEPVLAGASTGQAVRLVAGVVLVVVGLLSVAQAARGDVLVPACASRPGC